MLPVLWTGWNRNLSAPSNYAAKAHMARRGVDGLGVACHGTVATTEVGGAKVRSSLQNFPGMRMSGIVGSKLASLGLPRGFSGTQQSLAASSLWRVDHQSIEEGVRTVDRPRPSARCTACGPSTRLPDGVRKSSCSRQCCCCECPVLDGLLTSAVGARTEVAHFPDPRLASHLPLHIYRLNWRRMPVVGQSAMRFYVCRLCAGS